MCSMESLGDMGWLRIGKRTEVISPYPRRQPPDPSTPGEIIQFNKQEGEGGTREKQQPPSNREVGAGLYNKLPKQEIGMGRLLPPMGRTAPTLYGPADWHKFRWACDDYPWVSKLAFSVIIEEGGTPANIEGSVGVQGEEGGESSRELQIRTEMWLEHTSYLAYFLLLPTWWILARPLCSVIHYGVVDNIEKTQGGHEAA
eukprot:jgi/Bigna1/74069/fgenesh1_pg.27_\